MGLDATRDAARFVAENATFVKIKYEKIPSYIQEFPLTDKEDPQHDQAYHYLNQGSETITYFFVLSAINFGSGYFPFLKKLPGKSGYFTIAHSLKAYFLKNAPITVETLENLFPDVCEKIFGQNNAGPAVKQLMQLFSQAINQLGAYVRENFNGSFLHLLEKADRSCEKLIQLMKVIPFYYDVSPYNGREIPFYKRAQLLAADLVLASHDPLVSFYDLDKLTIFADNLVPHVLRIDGILAYDLNLSNRIEHQELIPPGSLEEIEIRACALHAVELIKKAIQQVRSIQVESRWIDQLLWNKGQNQKYKKHPRHRTRTIFY